MAIRWSIHSSCSAASFLPHPPQSTASSTSDHFEGLGSRSTQGDSLSSSERTSPPSHQYACLFRSTSWLRFIFSLYTAVFYRLIANRSLYKSSFRKCLPFLWLTMLYPAGFLSGFSQLQQLSSRFYHPLKRCSPASLRSSLSIWTLCLHKWSNVLHACSNAHVWLCMLD